LMSNHWRGAQRAPLFHTVSVGIGLMMFQMRTSLILPLKYLNSPMYVYVKPTQKLEVDEAYLTPGVSEATSTPSIESSRLPEAESKVAVTVCHCPSARLVVESIIGLRSKLPTSQ